jgi:hypothetical protein
MDSESIDPKPHEESLHLLRMALEGHASEDCLEKSLLAAVRRVEDTRSSIGYSEGVGFAYHLSPMPTREEDGEEIPETSTIQESLAAVCGVPDRHRATVDLISRACPFQRPKWMAKDEYENIVGRMYEKSFADRLKPSPETVDMDPLTTFVRGAVRLAFGQVRAEKLFGPALSPKVSRDLWESVITVHSYDIAQAMRGHHDDLLGRAYSSLASALTYAVPLGIKLQPSAAYCHWVVVKA